MPEFIDPRLLADRRIFRIFVRVLLAEASALLSWNFRVEHANPLFQAICLGVASWAGLQWGMFLTRDWYSPRGSWGVTDPFPVVYVFQTWFWNNVLAATLWLVSVAGTGMVAEQFWLVIFSCIGAYAFAAALGAISADPAWRIQRQLSK